MAIDYQRVKKLRKHFNMTQEEFSKAINMQQGSISRFEKGETKNIPIQYIQFLDKKNISLDWFMGWTHIMFINKETGENKETDDIDFVDSGLIIEDLNNEIRRLKKIKLQLENENSELQKDRAELLRLLNRLSSDEQTKTETRTKTDELIDFPTRDEFFREIYKQKPQKND